jgi:hypothetical protein
MRRNFSDERKSDAWDLLCVPVIKVREPLEGETLQMEVNHFKWKNVSNACKV